MTYQTTPLYSMTMKAGDALIGDLERALADLQQSQVKTNARFQEWKTAVKTPADPQSGQLVDAGMMGFFLDFLFGMPMFSGMSEASQGLAQVGLMAHQDRARPQGRGMSMSFDDLIASQRHVMNGALSGQKSQAQQFKKMRQVAMMMLVMMMSDMEEGESSGGSGTRDVDMAADVLRHPKLARFKQNRHSLSSIRDMFKHQAVSVAPQFDEPRYAA